MKHPILIFVSIAVVAAGLTFGVTYYKQTQNAVVSDAVQVDLLTDHAQPSVVSVGKGKFVQFNTKDNKTHNIGQGSGESTTHDASSSTHEHGPEGATHEHTPGTKESGTFGKNQAYRLQFNEKGTFTYHDHLNPKISIVVVVYESDKK
jgi:plastocyanin